MEYAAWKDACRESGVGGVQAGIVELEAQATRIAEFQQGMISGLLQTSEYAREFLHLACGPLSYGQDQAEIDRMVANRMQRQQVLYQPTKRVQVVMLEEVDGPFISRLSQLRRSLAAARPRSSASQQAREKNLCARSCGQARVTSALASMPHTIRLPACVRNPQARPQNVRDDGAVNKGETGQQAPQRGGNRKRGIREHRREPVSSAVSKHCRRFLLHVFTCHTPDHATCRDHLSMVAPTAPRRHQAAHEAPDSAAQGGLALHMRQLPGIAHGV